LSATARAPAIASLRTTDNLQSHPELLSHT
jgi:hypothetical protein